MGTAERENDPKGREEAAAAPREKDEEEVQRVGGEEGRKTR